MRAAQHGGPIVSRLTDGRQLQPQLAIYRIDIALAAAAAESIRLGQAAGFAVMEAPSRNVLGRIWDRIVGLWRCEIG